MNPLLIIMIGAGLAVAQAPPRCFAETTLRDSVLTVPANHRIVEVWWDLHCAACHRQLHDLAAQKRRGAPIVVLAQRVGIEPGDRATALRHLPAEVAACRALGTPSPSALPRVVVRDDKGAVVSRWLGYRSVQFTTPQETTP